MTCAARRCHCTTWSQTVWALPKQWLWVSEWGGGERGDDRGSRSRARRRRRLQQQRQRLEGGPLLLLGGMKLPCPVQSRAGASRAGPGGALTGLSDIARVTRVMRWGTFASVVTMISADSHLGAQSMTFYAFFVSASRVVSVMWALFNSIFMIVMFLLFYYWCLFREAA